MARAPHLRQNPAEPVTQAATPSRAVKTRERLLEHAIRLFARHGLEGVSLRTVMQSAGAKNTAAVHYHFGDRETLVLAAVDLIVASITTTVSKAEAAVLGILLDPDPQDVRAILESELLPLLTLPHRKPWGADAIKLLARIIMG